MGKIKIMNSLNGKKIIGYGTGMALHANIKELKRLNIHLDYIVDKNPIREGDSICGLPLYQSSKLRSEKSDKIYIIVFAYSPKSILNIFRELNYLGYKYLVNYVDCSLFSFYSISKKLSKRLNINSDYELFFKTRMLTLYSGIENQSSIAGTWLFSEIIKNFCNNTKGKIAECGVYKGGNAFISLLNLYKINISYHLFDTFEGFPELTDIDPISRKNDFADVNYSTILDTFSNFDNVVVHKGYFNKTLREIKSSKFSLVYIDCDLYEPTLYCLDFFYNKILSGGIILFHDYWISNKGLPDNVFEQFRGVNKAVEEFFADKPEELIVFPETTHALVIKNQKLGN